MRGLSATVPREPASLAALPYVALVIGAIAASSAGALIKLSYAPAVIIGAYRLAFATLLTAPFVAIGCRRELCGIGRRDLGLCILTGLVLAFHFLTWIASLKYTTVASAIVLSSMHPFFVAFGARLIYRERIDTRAVVSTLVAFLGVGIMVVPKLGPSGTGLWGNALALMAGAAFAGYLLIGQRLRQRMSATSYVFAIYGVSSAALFLFGWGMGVKLWPYPSRELLIFLALALFPTIMGHTTFNWALGHVRAMAVSVVNLMEPAFAVVIAFFLIGEVPTVFEFIGGVVTLAGTAMYLFTNAARTSTAIE